MKHACLVFVSGVLLLGCIHCAGSNNPDTAKAKPLTWEEDVKAVNLAWGKAKTAEEKVKLGTEFLKRNTKRPEILEIIESVAANGYLQELKDPSRMMAFARDQVAHIDDPKLKKQADIMLIRLYGKAGDHAGLRTEISNVKSRRELTLDEYAAISDAALNAKDWETAYQHYKLLIQKNTAATIQSEVGNQILSAKQMKDAIDQNQCRGLLGTAQALAGKRDFAAAIATYTEAGRLATYNYAGYPNYPYWDLNLLWAQTLFEKGDFRAAIEKISVEAIICEREDAKDILKKAYASAKLGKDLDGFVAQTRTRIAKSIPAFAAVDYDGKETSYSNLKGKVTLVSLWSPFCGPCRVELPRLKSVYEELHKDGLEIVVVDGENATKDALKFIKESGLPYHFYEAGSKKETVAHGLFGAPNYPTSYLIDRNGKLVYAHSGYLDGDEKKQREMIIQFLRD